MTNRERNEEYGSLPAPEALERYDDATQTDSSAPDPEAWSRGVAGATDADSAQPGPPVEEAPAGSRYPDEQIRQAALQRLAGVDQLDSTAVQVRVVNGEVTLEGSVDGAHARATAESTVAEVEGVTNVRNLLHVRSEGQANRG